MAEKKKRQAGDLSAIIRKAGQEVTAAEGQAVITTAKAKIFSVLEYIESPWGLNTRLYPAQRFIVKLYYNIELDRTLPDDPFRRIRIRDPFSEKIIILGNSSICIIDFY